ncbi:hypothetical protein [Gilliamella sp. Lep-s21]|uniref:hypothetical protein n=1 Tax=Gilliamella sp. Lep-s21 TaxID=2687309 RepID=UPI001323BF94|nr:hypothetical protein [Gilliamella sp. Lep-s21]MWP50011.1 hypothetical protein [Gilliamella sp. Lep-s35]MWP78010.1 hypothetical protein [Gilliamella sp. Lep-s21]
MDEKILTEGIIYRAGSGTLNNFTPAVKDLPGGLSTFTTTEVMIKKMPSTSKAQIIDISKLGSGVEAVLDGSDGHVSIRPKGDLDGSALKKWTELKGVDAPNPLAEDVKKGHIGEWKPSCK